MEIQFKGTGLPLMLVQFFRLGTPKPFFPCFPFLRNSNFYTEIIQMRFQWTVEGSAKEPVISGHVSGLCWLFPVLFLFFVFFGVGGWGCKHMTSRYGLSCVLHWSSFFKSLKDMLDGILRYPKYSANSFFLMSVKPIFGFFLVDSPKENFVQAVSA